MNIRAAVIQTSSAPFDKAATVSKVINLIHEAAATGAQLLVFPEALVSAYPNGADFGARVGGRQPRGREEFLRYHASAMDVPGPELNQLLVPPKKPRAGSRD
jgi:nitrilase